MGYIEGWDRRQQVLFPESLDDYVAADNPVRFIDAFVESLDLVELGFTRAEPAGEGRPGYDPRDLLRLFIYGYLNRTRSSRKLEAETHRNLEVIWLMRKLKPDHKTIAVFRRENTAALKRVTREFTLLCKDLGLFDASLVFLDGSKIKAVNSRERNFTGAKLSKLVQRIDTAIAQYLGELERADRSEEGNVGTAVEDLSEKIELLQARRAEYEAQRKQLKEGGQDQLSMTDSESRRMKVRGGFDVCYNAQIAVDAKHHLIVAYEVTNQVTDIEQLAPMALLAKEELEVETLEVAADRGYHNGAHVVACEENGITPYVPAVDPSKNRTTGRFTKESFSYCAERDAYRCPTGHWLGQSTSTVVDGRRIHYYSNGSACAGCPVRSECTSAKARRISRTPEEAQVWAMRKRLEERSELMAQRKGAAEHPFGTMKRAMDAGYFLLKGLRGVNGEFSLSVLAYNIKRTINLLGVECLLEALKQRKLAAIRG
jgi:transposase